MLRGRTCPGQAAAPHTRSIPPGEPRQAGWLKPPNLSGVGKCRRHWHPHLQERPPAKNPQKAPIFWGRGTGPLWHGAGAEGSQGLGEQLTLLSLLVLGSVWLTCRSEYLEGFRTGLLISQGTDSVRTNLAGLRRESREKGVERRGERDGQTSKLRRSMRGSPSACKPLLNRSPKQSPAAPPAARLLARDSSQPSAAPRLQPNPPRTWGA